MAAAAHRVAHDDAFDAGRGDDIEGLRREEAVRRKREDAAGAELLHIIGGCENTHMHIMSFDCHGKIR